MDTNNQKNTTHCQSRDVKICLLYICIYCKTTK